MKTINTTIITCLCIAISMVFPKNLHAQNTRHFSLEQAIEYANVHNYNIINSGKDLELAKQKIKESLAEGLPQINASIHYHDNLERPVFVLPGEFVGEPGTELAVQFGTKYDADLSGQLTQLIFDGRYLVGLKAAKVALEKSNKDFFKNKLAVKEQISNAYYQILAIKESLHIVDSILAVTKKLSDETNHIYQAGMAKDVDVDQVNLLVSNLESTQSNLKSQYGIATALLKFYLGLGDRDTIVLTDSAPLLLQRVEREIGTAAPFDVNKNIDMQTIQTMKQISKLQIMLAKAAYVPTLNAILSYETQAQRPIWNFLNKGPWYQSAIVGVTMNIPILSSGSRASQLKQAKIAYQQTSVLERQTENQLKIQYETLLNDYFNAKRIYENKNKNRTIAEKIYQKTMEEFRQGMATSLDLLNTHNQFLNAESEFINSGLALFQSSQKLITTSTIAQ
ncbi:MAG: TolC family protein [Bacteroidales bacterium]|nr:TolC family protein [Bacteroidales bacterium]